MIAIGVVAAVVGTAISLSIDWFPERGSSDAGRIDTVYDVLLVFSVPIFVLVMAIAIYSVIRFRAKPGDTGDGAPLHGDTRLEILWVTVPFLIVTGLAIYAWVVLDDIEAKKPNELQVKVTGQQFTWTFEYPQQKVKSPQLVLPQGRPVDFRIRTNDVIHSFWVPEFRLKTDAVPGITTRLRLTPSRPGTYDVVCAELCGIGHATMRQTVRVVPGSQFASWLQERRGGGGGDRAEGGNARQTFVSTGCGGCHRLADAQSSGGTGPSLDELASVAARRKPRTSAEDYVRESITDPNAFLVRGFPRGVMPGDYEQQLSAQEIDSLVEYLLRVGRGGQGS